MKNNKQIDEMWHEQITSCETPTKNQIEKEVLEELFDGIKNYKMPKDYPNTNYKAYKYIAELYEQNNNLEYDIIAKTFALENRTLIDLQNLKEFIVCVTLMGGNDILKAQVRNDKKNETAELKKHEKRCQLMSMLLETIDSVIATLDF